MVNSLLTDVVEASTRRKKEDRFVGAHIAAAERDHRMSLERQSVVTARPAYRKSDDVTVLFARRPRITGAVTLPKCE
jgi:hypothetical protein